MLYFYVYSIIVSIIVTFTSAFIFARDLIINKQVNILFESPKKSLGYILFIIPIINILFSFLILIIMILYRLYTNGNIKFNIVDYLESLENERIN